MELDPKKDIKPVKSHLVYEMNRRSFGRTPPRSKHWSIARCILWLNENPVTNAPDIEFLRETIRSFRADVVEANAEIPPPVHDGNWRGKTPYLRLILCLVQNDIKPPVAIVDCSGIHRHERCQTSSWHHTQTHQQKIEWRWPDGLTA